MASDAKVAVQAKIGLNKAEALLHSVNDPLQNVKGVAASTLNGRDSRTSTSFALLLAPPRIVPVVGLPRLS